MSLFASLPTVAQEGRGSSYALPGLLFAGLAAAMKVAAPPEVWTGGVVAAFILVVAAGIHDSTRGRNGS